MTPGVLGTRLKQLRMQHGWSAAGLAHRSGVSQRTIAALETGVTNGVSVGTLRSLAQAFGVPMSVVLAEAPIPDRNWARGGSAWQQVRREIAAIRRAA